MMCPSIAVLGVLAAVLTASPSNNDELPDLQTIAESTGFTCTSTSEETSHLVAAIAASDRRAGIHQIGVSNEGRPLDVLLIADPLPPAFPPARPSDTADTRLRILIIGNIHAGEVCGKEAALMFARDLLAADDPRLNNIVLAIVPNYNPDGNDRMDPGNRPGQIGPACGMGQRPNAQGLDLNRDWVKLESPEARAMVQLLTTWDPHLIIDTHTTNGSQHRYDLTYANPLNPTGAADPIAFIRDELLPNVTARLQGDGYESFHYGNFNRAHTTWSTYSAQPRFGGPYRGLRGQMSILSEAYAYIDYERRVRVTYAFLEHILQFAHEQRDVMRTLHDETRAATIERGRDPQPDDLIGVRFELAAALKPVDLKGFELDADEQGRLRPSDRPTDHRVVHRDHFVATRSVPRPHAYLLEPGQELVVEKLRQHGIVVTPCTGTATVETWTITAVDREPRPFQGHHQVTVEATARDQSINVPEGSFIVRLDQPLGTLAAWLLEPLASDGLLTWNFFDDGLEPGADFPVHRVRRADDLSLSL